MSIAKLAKAKSFSGIYFSERDDELQDLLDGAEEYVAKFLNRDDLTELSNVGDSPPPDSPGEVKLNAIIQTLVFDVFDDFWQNKGTSVLGTIVADNPTWIRAAHLYRLQLGV